MFGWFKKQKPGAGGGSWSDLRDLADDFQAFARFRQETGRLLCALGNPTAAGISQEDVDTAVAEAMAAYNAGRAPYQGGALAGFDRFLTSDRIIRKREDYLHIHERGTDEDLHCIHIFSLPCDPAGLQWVEVFMDDSAQKAIATIEHEGIEERFRIRWWLVREQGEWKIHDFEHVFG